MLLFDEATAAVDSASEAAFWAALQSTVLSRGCGVLTVAHRLATALQADRVVVLDRGRIVEQGPPAKLAAGTGRFAALLELERAGVGLARQPLRERPGHTMALTALIRGTGDIGSAVAHGCSPRDTAS